MIIIKKLFIIFFFICVLITIVVSNLDYQGIDSKITVYIDPGHGGIDGGSVGRDGTVEKDINLAISLRVKKVLEEHDYRVLLTRDGDYDLARNEINVTNRKRLDIYKRVDMINESKANLYISIHCNSYPNANTKGAQVFYKANDSISKALADSIQTQLVIELQNSKRIAKSINNKYLVDHVNIPGCIVEVGFLTNPEEVSLLNQELYQERIAYSIFYGITDFINSDRV